jgi:hypothetical protein
MTPHENPIKYHLDFWRKRSVSSYLATRSDRCYGICVQYSTVISSAAVLQHASTAWPEVACCYQLKGCCNKAVFPGAGFRPQRHRGTSRCRGGR